MCFKIPLRTTTTTEPAPLNFADEFFKPSTVINSLPARKRLFEHEGGHSCFRDLDGRRIVAEMASWFDEHLAAGGV